jgi:secondary thiamine-phosphate synthase enzyme
VYVPHSTAAIVVNEHEEGLIQDVLKMTEKLFSENVGWLHDRIDNNAHAHLTSIMFGISKVFPVKDGRLIRGRWQNIFLLELDGSRSRRVFIQTSGE